MSERKFNMPSVTWLILGVLAIGVAVSQFQQEPLAPSKKEKVGLVEPTGLHKDEILDMKKKYPERLSPLISKMMSDGVISEKEFASIKRTYEEIEKR